MREDDMYDMRRQKCNRKSYHTVKPEDIDTGWAQSIRSGYLGSVQFTSLTLS